MNIDKFRQISLSLAEAFDAWRVIPRLLIGMYSYMVYAVVSWYMNLSSYIIEGCISSNISDCIIQAPITQHTALVTAVIGVAAAVFGLYSSTGKKWGAGFTSWKNNTKSDLPPK